MKLMTQEILKRIPKLDEGNKTAHVKFFAPWSNWTWFATEFDPVSKTFFGLVEGFEREWGYFSLAELESVRGRGGLKIERDLYFEPTVIDAD